MYLSVLPILWNLSTGLLYLHWDVPCCHCSLLLLFTQAFREPCCRATELLFIFPHDVGCTRRRWRCSGTCQIHWLVLLKLWAELDSIGSLLFNLPLVSLFLYWYKPSNCKHYSIFSTFFISRVVFKNGIYIFQIDLK